MNKEIAMKRNLLLVFSLLLITVVGFAQKPLAWYNHTQLNVNNIDTSVAFYTQVFELDTILCPFSSTAKKRVKWLNAGANMQIHVIENVGSTIHIVPDGHLGFNIRSLQEIKERLLKFSYGYQTGKLKIVYDGKMPYGAKMALFQDPDGNIVHVIEGLPTTSLQDKEAEIRRLEDLERVSAVKGDSLVLFDKLWSPNMVVHNPLNKIGTVERTKMQLRTGNLNYASFERTIEKITFNENIAIVMGEEKIKPQGKQDNAGKIVTRRFTNIWQYANNNWSMIARQATIIKIEPL